MSSAGYRCSAVALQAELTPRANLSSARGQTSVLSLDERGDPLWRQRQRPNGDTERIGNGVRDAPGLLAGGWHWIIGKGPRQEPAVVTVSEHLVERSTSAVRESAEHLAVEEHRVQEPPGLCIATCLSV